MVASTGCDSVITTITSFLESYQDTINLTSCDINQVGTIVDSFVSVSGCDSIITTIYTLNGPSFSSITGNTCYIDSAGFFRDTIYGGAFNGCDSIINSIIFYIPPSTSTVIVPTCDVSDVETIIDTLYGSSYTGCDSIIITIKQLLPSPVATFTYIKNGLEVTFNSTSTNATSIEWDFGDGTSSTVNPSITHFYGGEGSYDVMLIASNICGIDTFNRVVVIANTGIDLNAMIETLTLYPNPNNGVFTLKLEADFNLPQLDLVLFDVLGDVVDQRTVQFNGRLTENYNLQELPPGTYMLQLNSEKGSVTLKVSVIK